MRGFAILRVLGVTPRSPRPNNALTFATSAAGPGAIDLPDRTVLAAKAKTMQLGGLSVTEAETPPMTADLEPFSLAEGGKADIDITVTGGVRSDDQVFFDLDGDSTMDDGEELDIDDGEATGDFRLDDADDLPARVHYVPGGDDMSRTTFSTQFAIEFDSAAGAPKILPVVADLGYAGVKLEARAYAIPKPGSNGYGQRSHSVRDIRHKGMPRVLGMRRSGRHDTFR